MESMDQSTGAPVNIHAPFTRAERMEQLADIDRVSVWSSPEQCALSSDL